MACGVGAEHASRTVSTSLPSPPLQERKRLELEELETFASKENKGAQAFKDYTHPALLLL